MADAAAVHAVPVTDFLVRDEKAFLAEWMQDIRAAVRTTGSITDVELGRQCARFLNLFRDGLASSGAMDAQAPRWKTLRDFLGEISQSRGDQPDFLYHDE
jgi:hypothetical protein